MRARQTTPLPPFKFDLQEVGGALGDLGTLLPLAMAMVLVNGLDGALVLVAAGLFYVGSGLYFRIPMPVQPLKAVAAISIALALPPSVIGAAGIIMGLTLIVLSWTNLISYIARLFPMPVVRGIQLSIGLVLVKKGAQLIFDDKTAVASGVAALGLGQLPLGVPLAIAALLVFFVFRSMSRRWPGVFSPSLAMVIFGFGAGALMAPLPPIGRIAIEFSNPPIPRTHDFWLAFTTLVIPQLPLTLGNAVVGTWDAARTYFADKARRASPRSLTASMGLANLAAGMLGAMPMCHGSGGLTAHYRLGARTGASNLIIGGLLLTTGIIFGRSALPLLSFMPLSVLGVMLAVVGAYHAFLARAIKGKNELLTTMTVAAIAVAWGNLALGTAAGIILHWAPGIVAARGPAWRRLHGPALPIDKAPTPAHVIASTLSDARD